MNNEKKFALLGIIFLMLLGLGVFIRHQSSQTKTIPSSTPEMPKESKPYISIKSQDGQKLYKKNEPVMLLLYADSKKQQISGFDVSLVFNSAAYKFVKQIKLQPDFDITVSEVSIDTVQTRLLITGTVPPQKTVLPVLTNTSLLALTFVPRPNAPAMPFVIEYKKGSLKESNLIDIHSNDILEGIQNNPFIVYLQEGEMKIALGRTDKIDNTLEIQVTKITVPDPGCGDCITSATLEVKDLKTGKIAPLTFQSGGLAGIIDLTKQAFSYQFEVTDIKEKQITIRYGF